MDTDNNFNKPEQTFQHGTCCAAVFNNQVNIKGRDILIKKVTFSKRYKDRDGQWKNCTSLDINDIPKMIAALTNAYHFLTQKKQLDPMNPP